MVVVKSLKGLRLSWVLDWNAECLEHRTETVKNLAKTSRRISIDDRGHLRSNKRGGERKRRSRKSLGDRRIRHRRTGPVVRGLRLHGGTGVRSGTQCAAVLGTERPRRDSANKRRRAAFLFVRTSTGLPARIGWLIIFGQCRPGE